MSKKSQRGQSLVLLALAFVGLAAFVGLTVDAGILFSGIGHLRRAVDAAALGAANQFREGLTMSQLEKAADDLLKLNGLDAATAAVYICEEPINPGGPYSGYHDPTLCQPDGDPRKEVRVVADLPVEFAFLPIIGFDSVTITADAISETAAVDLVLVLDNSPSMAYDLCKDLVDNDGDGTTDDCKINEPPLPGEVPPISESDVPRCTAAGDCQPFEDVRSAALSLAGRMYYPYDRMAVVTFALTGQQHLDLVNGDNFGAVAAQINSLQVEAPPLPGAPPCDDWLTDQNPAGCTSTNTAGGLRAANNILANQGRQEAVWIAILLSDGAANAALDDSSPPNWICPGTTAGQPTWIQPFCRDPFPATRHSSGDVDYDAEDRARDMADVVGCLPSPNQAPACPGAGGNGAVIFTIGLGNIVIDNDQCDKAYYGAATCNNDASILGEVLLRYVASVGDDGDPATDPCSAAPTGTDCGNYYYSPQGSGLLRVFEAIAGRIFTRLNH